MRTFKLEVNKDWKEIIPTTITEAESVLLKTVDEANAEAKQTLIAALKAKAEKNVNKATIDKLNAAVDQVKPVVEAKDKYQFSNCHCTVNDNDEIHGVFVYVLNNTLEKKSF